MWNRILKWIAAQAFFVGLKLFTWGLETLDRFGEVKFVEAPKKKPVVRRHRKPYTAH